MTDHTHHTEHKAPAKKRATRKKVVDKRTHREREFDAFAHQLIAALRQPIRNEQQIKALTKKIQKRAPEGI